jgi:urea transporter
MNAQTSKPRRHRMSPAEIAALAQAGLDRQSRSEAATAFMASLLANPMATQLLQRDASIAKRCFNDQVALVAIELADTLAAHLATVNEQPATNILWRNHAPQIQAKTP